MADMPAALNVYRAKKMAEGEEVLVWGRVREEVEGSGAFTIIDDVIDSGWTLTVGGHLLRSHGAGDVYPFAFALDSGGAS